jgi:RNA polymerase sigma factor (sigma-70 family)
VTEPNAEDEEVTLTRDDLLDLVPMQARMVARRFRGYVEMQDLIQEGYEYVLRRWRMLVKEDPNDVDVKIRRHCERYARTQKADRVGYKADDEFFYAGPKGGTTYLSDILPFALSDPWPSRPDGMDEGDRVSGGRPASEGNNWFALLADVSRAYARLDHADRLLLHRRFHGRYRLVDIAGMMETSDQWVSDEIQRALKRLLSELGGESPWG